MAKSDRQSGTVAPVATKETNGGAALPAVRAPGGVIERVPVTDFPIATVEREQLADVMRAIQLNTGGTKVNAFDFARIRVPSGGQLAWQLMDAETGELSFAQVFDGIILSFNDQKSFWKTRLNQPGAQQGPPSCFSLNLIKGNGDPGIQCANCPNNVFGSDPVGKKGKACKDVRLHFVMRRGAKSVMPELLVCPPTSLKPMKAHLWKLAQRGIAYYSAVTSFKLVEDKNAAGTKYAKIEAGTVGRVPKEWEGRIQGFAEMIAKITGRLEIGITAEDLRGGDDGNLNPAAADYEQEIIEGSEADPNADRSTGI